MNSSFLKCMTFAVDLLPFHQRIQILNSVCFVEFTGEKNWMIFNYSTRSDRNSIRMSNRSMTFIEKCVLKIQFKSYTNRLIATFFGNILRFICNEKKTVTAIKRNCNFEKYSLNCERKTRVHIYRMAWKMGNKFSKEAGNIIKFCICELVKAEWKAISRVFFFGLKS